MERAQTSFTVEEISRKLLNSLISYKEKCCWRKKGKTRKVSISRSSHPLSLPLISSQATLWTHMDRNGNPHLILQHGLQVLQTTLVISVKIFSRLHFHDLVHPYGKRKKSVRKITREREERKESKEAKEVGKRMEISPCAMESLNASPILVNRSVWSKIFRNPSI